MHFNQSYEEYLRLMRQSYEAHRLRQLNEALNSPSRRDSAGSSPSGGNPNSVIETFYMEADYVDVDYVE